MAIDMGRVLGVLLEGAVKPPRRRSARRRAAGNDPLAGLGLRSARSRAALGRTLAALAGVAVEALSRSGSPAPAPLPRPAPDLPPPGPRRPPEAGTARGGSVPRAGAGSPWSRHGADARPGAAPAAGPAAEAEESEALLLIRAMIAAAKADGTVDAGERAAIGARLDAAGLSAEERDFVLRDLESPMTPEDLAEEARDPMLAAQLYAAAVAAAGAVEASERAWLDRLAEALRLDRAAAEAIEARLGGR